MPNFTRVGDKTAGRGHPGPADGSTPTRDGTGPGANSAGPAVTGPSAAPALRYCQAVAVAVAAVVPRAAAQ